MKGYETDLTCLLVQARAAKAEDMFAGAMNVFKTPCA